MEHHHAHTHPDDFVSKVNQIKMAEEEALKIVNDAKEHAQQIVVDARTKAAKIILESNQEATAAKDKEIEATRKKIEEQTKNILAVARSQAAKFHSLKVNATKAKKIAQKVLEV